MMNVSELIPVLALWNNGAGIAPDSWIYINGRADHALGFCSLFWPEFVQFEGYVLRAPFDEARLRGWEASSYTRQQIETAMNAYLLDTIFSQDDTGERLKAAQKDRQVTIMADMLAAKLARDYPDRRFVAFAMQDDDFGVSFHQV